MNDLDLEHFQHDISDEDVQAAIRETRIRVSISADELKKLYVSARSHAMVRMAANSCVRNAMTRDVLAVNKFDDISHAVRILSGKNISGLPVVDGEHRVVGMISEADVVSMVGSEKGHTFMDYVRHFLGRPLPERKMGHIVADIMTSPAITVCPDAEISEAVRLMDAHRIRRLPVVDKEQRLVGLISRADVVRTLGKKLPEDR